MIKNALVIGNSEYVSLNKLQNPVNDADDFGGVLSSFNFDTTIRKNATIEEMDKIMDTFKENISDADVLLFYFAGHGFQVKGRNYLAAIDTPASDEFSLTRRSFELNNILEIFEGSNAKTKIIILDACRNNPFGGAYRGEANTTFAPINAPKGTIIAFSTSPGEKAKDGERRNGAYTEVLLSHIKTPSLSIEALFKRVRNSLNLITNGKQTSWEHTSLIGDFQFNYRYISGEYLSNYSKNAFADSKYTQEDNDLGKIVDNLKSHDWYKQNPAIGRLRTLNLSNYKVDSIFVLGRNIYQAACGNASNAKDYINNLVIELNKLEKEIAFHMLNGMLYEIYFDSRGKLRNKLKSGCFEEVLAVCEKSTYEECMNYIQHTLLPHENKVIYMPGNTAMVLDLYFETYEEDEIILSKVFHNGQNVLYDEDEDLFEFESSWNIGRLKYDKLEEKLSSVTACPLSKLSITDYGRVNNEEYVWAPNSFKLMNFVN